jgi:glycosyltransferase involved in cell wall biosynthesis
VFGITGVFRNIVVNSKEMEHEYRFYPRRYQARVQRIDHGFEPKTSNLSQSAARTEFSLPDDVVLLGSVARLHPLKNLDAAIRLLAINSEWHLALAGQGPARMPLERLAKLLGVRDRLHFVGELSPARVAVFLRMLDVFVFPSQVESFGIAAVEAAQAGVPVVANDLSVLREVLAVDHLPCALLVDAADPERFATAVQRLIDDVELKATLSSRARELSRRYSPEAMVASYVKLIESIAALSTASSQR